MSFLTYQDFETVKPEELADFVKRAIAEHKASVEYEIALTADQYDKKRNTTICNYVQTMMDVTGVRIVDITAANNKICSNFFHRLNTQRNMYSLGNGLTFEKEETKKKLGRNADVKIKQAAYKALIHGRSFIFWNGSQMYVFPVTEFKPLPDEDTGAVRAGIRFWQLAADKPLIAVLYTERGYKKFIYRKDRQPEAIPPERDRYTAYKITIRKVEATGEVEVAGEENWNGVLPIIPLYGSELKQSTLVGMREQIDSFDLIRSGFANNLQDCAEIYWIVKRAGGMDDASLAEFRTRLKTQHIASVNSEYDDGENDAAEPYTQQIPYEARKEYLQEIRAGIYEDFGGLDVHTIAAGATNDHIDAAYQPMDEEADDFEFQIIECIVALLALQGVSEEDATPSFKRNRISNQKEQTDMVMVTRELIGDELALKKLPFLTPDEVAARLEAMLTEEMSRFDNGFDDGNNKNPEDDNINPDDDNAGDEA